jgi:hypothetical protein
MTDEALIASFQFLWGDFGDYQWLMNNKPPLAHYTSIHTLELIMKHEELWLSNPLFMNDLEEMRFGLNKGVQIFEQSEEVDRAATTPERARALRHYFRYFYDQFDTEHAIDVFVFCLAQHNPRNTDGLLSMWRGYGQQGDGAALIFNTKFLAPRAESPLIVARVSYASVQERIAWMKEKLVQWCNRLVEISPPDGKLYLAAHQIFNLFKLYSLTSKHNGFEEERECRIIYLPERDPAGILKDRIGYAMGKRGVEPKLKLQIKPLPLEPTEQWTFHDIVDQIILGPSVSSPLARTSVVKMLEKIGKPQFASKVHSSTIPLRPAERY